MPEGTPNVVENRLLAQLSQDEHERLLPSLEIVSLDLQQILCLPGDPIHHVYFPTNSVLSLVTIMEDGVGVEIAMVGKEGMVGVGKLLGADTTPIKIMVRVPGVALRIKAELLRERAFYDSSLMRLLLRYTHVLFTQVAQSVACNSLHSLHQRCCRWLLMTHDRVGADWFPLTQEYLAQMLGVRRASVSGVARRLQESGLIHYSRGKIRVVDRKGLEADSCQCYAAVKAEYERVFA